VHLGSILVFTVVYANERSLKLSSLCAWHTGLAQITANAGLNLFFVEVRLYPICPQVVTDIANILKRPTQFTNMNFQFCQDNFFYFHFSEVVDRLNLKIQVIFKISMSI
jgi:hypothetical protein